MKIRKLTIKNYCGIAEMQTEIPPGGAIATGGNARGKTSWIAAVKAALLATGVGPEAIRIGEAKAEILVEADGLRIRRSITQKGSNLTVTNQEGDIWAKPQTRLVAMLGSSVDPLAFFLGDRASRRRQILAAMPITVTAEDLREWTGETWEVEEGRHGLDVLQDVRTHYYDKRAKVARDAKSTRAAYEAQRAQANEMMSTAEAPDPEGEDPEEDLLQARKDLEGLRRQEEEAMRSAKAMGASRELLGAMEEEVLVILATTPKPPAPEEFQKREQKIREWEAEIEILKSRVARLKLELDGMRREEAAAAEDQRKVAEKRKAIDSLRDSLDRATVRAPEDGMIRDAERAVNEATTRVRMAKQYKAATEEKAKADGMEIEAGGLAAEVEHLDGIVKRLTNEAPEVVARRSDAIPGLKLEGDAISLDGVALDLLSGSQALSFAVVLAKRASKAKILVVDGLERLDPEALPIFVKAATFDGWQLLATRVTSGDLEIEAIEVEDGGE